MTPRSAAAIVVAALAHFILGAIWFTVLAAAWLRGVGKTRDQLLQQGSPALAYSVAFFCNLLLAYAIYRVNRWGDFYSAGRGAVTGALLGIAVAAAVIITEMVFEARPLDAMMVMAGYPVIGMALMGAIIGAMVKPPARPA